MAGNVVRLVPHKERLKRDSAERLLAYLSGVPDDELPGYLRDEVSRLLWRHAEPPQQGKLWPGGYSMLSRLQTAVVWKAIRALPARDRPQDVRHVFDLVLLNLRQDTGEVMLRRDELAAELCPRAVTDAAKEKAADRVSRAMGVLERLGVIRRERAKVAGIRGRGVAHYFINPHVAWNGDLEVRKEAAKAQPKPPLLAVMEGGAQ